MRERDKKKLSALKLPSAPSSSDQDEARTTRSARGGMLQRRQDVVRAIGTGKQRMVQVLQHPPSRIKLWEGHNRNYDLLSPERCADLIEGFKRTGAQEFPAIVRRLKSDEYDYELICGARRHWTAAHLGWDLLIEVRELDDRQAFILQDIENRDREDVSDYERACDYAKALPLYFGGKQSEMAKFLEIDRGNFARLLDLAELPEPIVKAYGDLRDLKTHHGATYKKLLGDSGCKRRLLDRARSLAGQDASGKVVFATLKQAAQSADGPKTERWHHGPVDSTRKRAGEWSLSVRLPKTADARVEVEQALRAWLDHAIEQER